MSVDKEAVTFGSIDHGASALVPAAHDGWLNWLAPAAGAGERLPFRLLIPCLTGPV